MLITISRQAATNGELIAHQVAEHLGYRVFDREIVEEIARRLQVDPSLVREFDEATVNPVQALILEWRASLNAQIYERLLRQALHQVAALDHAVIIGRGANFVLKGPQVLNVRVVAPLDLRTAIFCAEHPVTAGEARQLIRRIDADRAGFARAIFHHDINDPTQYDLIINLAEFPPESAAELIMHASRINAATGLPLSVHASLPQHIALMTRHRRRLRSGL